MVGYAKSYRFFGKALREETVPKNVKMSGMSRFSGRSVKNEQAVAQREIPLSGH